jgi:hypothetical protein
VARRHRPLTPENETGEIGEEKYERFWERPFLIMLGGPTHVQADWVLRLSPAMFPIRIGYEEKKEKDFVLQKKQASSNLPHLHCASRAVELPPLH